MKSFCKSKNTLPPIKVKSKQEVCLSLTADLWNSMQGILIEDGLHPDDMNDLRHHIHAIQNILYTQLYIKKHGKYSPNPIAPPKRQWPDDIIE